MHFRHLFIFPNHHVLRAFFHRLEETMYLTSRTSGGYSRLTMMSYDGQHEISCTTVDQIERGAERYRGIQFDKVSVHEGVEITYRIHIFLQPYVAMASHELYGHPSLSRKTERHSTSDEENPYLPRGYVGELLRKMDEENWRRSLLGEWISSPL